MNRRPAMRHVVAMRFVALLLLLDVVMFLDTVKSRADGVSHLGSGKSAGRTSDDASRNGSARSRYGFSLQLVVVLFVSCFHLRLCPGVG